VESGERGFAHHEEAEALSRRRLDRATRTVRKPSPGKTAEDQPQPISRRTEPEKLLKQAK